MQRTMPHLSRNPESAASLKVSPLSGSIGAVVRGVDLAAEIDGGTFAAIRDAFHQHLVLVFPNQALTPVAHKNFARRFGELMVDPFIKSLPDHPEILEVVKEKHERVAFGESWHSDNTYLERPPLGSFLYSREVPAFGGDTLFANQYLAYETLSPGLREQLDRLSAIHSPWSYNQVIAQGGYYDEDRAMKLRNDQVMRDTQKVANLHPVVRTHPGTGRRALYVNSSYTLRFSDWTVEESQPLLNYLYQHASRPEFTCRVRWAADMLVLWDNRCAMHHPVNDYHGSRRVMHRVTVEGERPV